MATLTADQLNAIAKQSGYTGGTFSSTGLAPTTQVSNQSLGIPTINSTSLSSPTVVSAPKTTDNTNYAGMIAGAAQQAQTYTTPSGAQVDAQGNLASSPQPAPTFDIKSYIDSITGIQQPNAAQTYQKSYDASGLSQLKQDVNAKAAIATEAQGRLNNISAQLQALNTEAQAIPIQLQQQSVGRGITAGGLAPIQADQLRANALKALPLQAQAAVIQAEVATAQGNQKLAQDLYTQAQDHFDTLFKLQMQDAQNQYEFRVNLINKVYDFADKQQQRQLQTIERQQQQDYKAQQDAIDYQRQVNLIKLRQQSTPKIAPTTTQQISNLKLTTTQKSDLVDIQTLEDQLNKLQGYAADGVLEGIGSLGAGSLKSTAFSVFGIGSKEGADVRALIGNLKGQIAKLRGGTSFTVNEEKLLNSYVPGINESTASILAKVRGLQEFLASKKNAIIQIGGGSPSVSINDPLGIL